MPILQSQLAYNAMKACLSLYELKFVWKVATEMVRETMPSIIKAPSGIIETFGELSLSAVTTASFFFFLPTLSP